MAGAKVPRRKESMVSPRIYKKASGRGARWGAGDEIREQWDGSGQSRPGSWGQGFSSLTSEQCEVQWMLRGESRYLRTARGIDKERPGLFRDGVEGGSKITGVGVFLSHRGAASNPLASWSGPCTWLPQFLYPMDTQLCRPSHSFLTETEWWGHGELGYTHFLKWNECIRG